jgi:hypothetical protein
VLAVVLGAVAWKLLREDRDRSAARVAALEFEAYAEPESAAGPVEPPLPPADPAPARFSILEDDEADEGGDVRTPVRIRPGAAMSGPMFGATQATPSPSGVWRFGLATAAMLVVGAGAIYGAHSTGLIAEAGRRLTAPRLTSIEPLELLSIRHAAHDTGQFTVTGLVHNPAAGASLEEVVAVVYLFDDEGRYFASGRARIESHPFRPGDESPFVVSIPTTERVSRYRVGFRLDDGAVVNHVDRRGQLPPGTTGDAINGMDRGVVRPNTTPARTEG